MHKKFALLLFLRLPENLHSATLVLHAKAPGCWRSVNRPAEVGRPRKASARHGHPIKATAFHAETAPREPGTSFGSDRARRGRRDLFRQVRVGSKGHPSDTSRTPTRKATAGHQCPWPSSEARPSPCAGVAARPEDVIPSGVFERSDASGAFGIPPGSSEPWRNSTGSVGTSGLPCGPSGPSGGLEGTWEIFGFPRTRPVAFVPDLRVQTGLSTERLRPFRR